MDADLRSAARQQGASPEGYRSYLRQLARTSGRLEMLRQLATSPLAECGARRLGGIKGSQDLYLDSGQERESLEPEDFRVRLIGWQLPPDLDEEVLLEVRRGRTRRRVALLPRGGRLTLELQTRSGDAVEGVDLQVTLRSGHSGQGGVLARIIQRGHDLRPEWEAFFRGLAEAADAPLELEHDHAFLD